MLWALGDPKWDLVFSPMLLWAMVYIILERGRQSRWEGWSMRGTEKNKGK